MPCLSVVSLATVARLEAVLDANTRGFDSKIRQSEGVMHKAGHAIGVAALAAGAAIGTGLAVTAKIGWDEFSEGAKVAAQTNAVLKSTAGIANVTAKNVDDLGHSLMMKSGIDDEVIKSGENLLLTFRGIRNEVGAGNDIFDQATKATLDMSVAMGKDLNSSVILVGKALQDPIRGLSALRRVGVQLTTSQEALITKLVESGHTMRAQKIILGELNKEFGGSAKAAGETLPGKINILKESFRNFSGDLVARTVPVLTNILDFLNDIGKAKSLTAKIRVVWTGIEEAAKALIDNLRVALLGETTRTPIKLPGGQIIEWDTRTTQGLVDVIDKAIRDADWGQVARDMARGLWLAFVNAVKAIPRGTASDFVRAVGFDPNHDYSKDLDKWLRKQLRSFEGTLADSLKPQWGKTGQWISDQLNLPAAARILESFSSWIGSHWRQAMKSAVLGTFIPLPGIVRDKVSDLVTLVKDHFNGLVDFFRELPGRMGSAIASGAAELKDAVYGLLRDVLPGWAEDALGISSPSKVFMQIGHAVVDGLIAGIKNKAGDLKSAALGAVGDLYHFATTGPGPAAGTVGGNARIGQVMAAQIGWTGANWTALYNLWQRESGWNQFARNASSGAYGIPQALPASKMGAAANPPTSSPSAQISWGLNYIRGRYGNPLAAWQHEMDFGWYDRGGWLPKGLSLALNTTGKPERVGGGPVNNFYLANHGVLGSETEVLNWLQSATRRYERRNGRSPF